MMRFWFSLILMAFLLNSVVATTVVDVFTSEARPLVASASMNPLPKSATINVYQLDQLNQLQNGMNAFVKEFVHSNDPGEFQKAASLWIFQHQTSYKKLAQMIQNLHYDHITQIPAIVFNHQAMVLGTTDINQAYQLYVNRGYHRHRISNGGQNV